MRKTNIVGRTIGHLENLESRLALSGAPPTVVDVAVASSTWAQAVLDHLPGEFGYSIPDGSTAQSTPLPWSSLDRISITFSEDVHIEVSDLSLSGVTNSEYSFEHFFYDPVAMTATWELTTPLANQERLLLDLDADGVDPIRDLDGNLLDGDWTNNSSQLPSGNGTAGGDFEFSFNVLVADIDGTVGVDNSDALSISYKNGESVGDSGYNLLYDLDGSGTIDNDDWQAALNLLWTTLPLGNPTGWTNDAPTTAGFDLASIADRSVDYQIALDAVFADLEDTSSNLSFAILEQTNAGLFDSTSIAPATGILTLNAAATGNGRSLMTVQATDSGGLSVEAQLTVDVGYTNLAPIVTLHQATYNPTGFWKIEGTVSDDDEVEGMIVELSQLIDQRVAVENDGTFLFKWESPAGQPGGFVYAATEDPHDTTSNVAFTWVGQ